MTTPAPDRSIFSPKGKRVYSIDPGRPFLDDLAQTLSKELTLKDPLSLARATIYLPTRRSARALVNSFQKVAEKNGSRAVLLPAIKTLGDIEEDSLTGFKGTAEKELSLAPAISSMQRLLTLASLVAAKERAFSGFENWAAAVSAGRELGKLLDSFYAEEIDFSALNTLVPEDFAAHWGQSVEFLKIISEQWPTYLKVIDKLDPAKRRSILIDGQIEHWQEKTPHDPIIVAGTTASAPAVARLVDCVSQLPRGVVILPGIDQDLAQSTTWEMIDAPHPQAGLKKLIQFLDLAPHEILPWPESGHSLARTRLTSLALRPAEATDDWRDLVAAFTHDASLLNDALHGLSLIETPDDDSEASAIATIFRLALENPAQTAMLVTPDRNLGRRVALKLRRWNISVDDSGGIPLANSRTGTFLRLVAQWLYKSTDPTALIEMAQHPLANFDLPKHEAHEAIDALNKDLRGRFLPESLDSWFTETSSTLSPEALKIAPPLLKAISCWKGRGTSLSKILATHLRVAEIIAESKTQTDGLWRGSDGREAADQLQNLVSATQEFDINPADDYHRIFAELINDITVRHGAGSHPRLSILGPLEARMQSADIVILGSLNEGIWPSDAGSDPFLSRPMREKLGLPLPENKIGLAAHDFAQLSASKTVYLTRPKKTGGSPSNPSRWIVRLKNILNGTNSLDSIDESAKLKHWRLANDEPKTLIKISAPAPCPPESARPTKLYVTRIEKLMRDPYSIWARDILKLYKLDELSPTFGPANLGIILHSIFEDFVQVHTKTMPPDAVGIFQSLLAKHGPKAGFDNVQQAFWRKSLDQTFAWFIDFHQQALSDGKPIALEESGTLEIQGPPLGFTLNARVDRIDRLNNGALAIIDYKSRSIPSLAQTKTFSPQLALTGLIARAGGFEPINDMSVPINIDRLAYVRTLRRGIRGNQSQLDGENATEAIRDAQERLSQLISHFQTANVPFHSQPRPQFKDEFGDFDQLARRREWLSEDNDE